MHVELSLKRRPLHPTPAASRIHDLHERAKGPPRHHKMREPGGQARDDQGWQTVCLTREHVLNWHHLLIRNQAEGVGQIFQGIDGSSVDAGVTSLAQSTVARLDAETR